MPPALPPFLFTALLGISGGIMVPVALAVNLPSGRSLLTSFVYVEIFSFVLAMGGMLVWRRMKARFHHIGARPLFTDLYMTLLGLMGFTDALDPQGSWSLTILMIGVSVLGLLSHFRSVTWSLGYIAPHWHSRASTAFAVMGPSLITGFCLGLAMLSEVDHHPAMFSALSVVLFSLIGVSFFFSVFLRPSLTLPTFTSLVALLYLVPTAVIIYGMITQHLGVVSISAVSALGGLIWHTRQLLRKLPDTPYPGLLGFQAAEETKAPVSEK